MKLYAILIAGTMLSGHAFALDKCTPSQDDTEVRICKYSPTQRYEINGVVGFPVNIRFDPGETIKRPAFGYTGVDDKGKPTPTWRGPLDPDKEEKRFVNNLPIWPFKDGKSSLVVITQMQDGSERMYLFNLNARTVDQPGDTTSAVIFEYPGDAADRAAKEVAEKKKAAVLAWQAKQSKVSEDAAIARLKTDVFYGPQNPEYRAFGDPKYKYLSPSQITDNGQLTTMTWPENLETPTVTILNKVTGEERIPAISHQGRLLVITGTSEWFRLRLGPKAVIDVQNLKWSPERPDPQTGTTSTDVVRQVMYQGSK
jgi:type IV secretory pathway VirB9-like protein